MVVVFALSERFVTSLKCSVYLIVADLQEGPTSSNANLSPAYHLTLVRSFGALHLI